MNDGDKDKDLDESPERTGEIEASQAEVDEPDAEDADAGESNAEVVAATVPSERRTDSKRGSSAWIVGVAALALGAAGGWFGHQLKLDKAMKAADAAVAGQGDAARGPCKDWETKICDEFGSEAFACNQAKSSSPILSGSACELALNTVRATITKIHAARSTCDTMSAKLCAEIGAETRTCQMVKKDTPTFPPEKCEEIAKNYDEVLAQLKSMEQRAGMGGPPGGHPGMGGPPGRHPGMGGPPGMAPPPGMAAPPASHP
jgi:hypothetical protein